MTRKCTRRPKIYGQKFWLSQRYGHIWFLIVGFNNSRLIVILEFDFDFVRFYQFFRYRFFHDFDSENCLKNDFISISIPKKYVRIADSSILVRIDPALMITYSKYFEHTQKLMPQIICSSLILNANILFILLSLGRTLDLGK